MQAGVTGLLRDGGRVVGVRCATPGGARELRGDLVLACDGRGSLARSEAGLTVREYAVPFDVWWFRAARAGDAGYEFIPRTAPGQALILIPRPGYFQIAYLIPKGRDAELRAIGLDAFRAALASIAPEVDPGAITSWDDGKLLDVKRNRLRRWYVDGMLCIGDAAHAMSPAGGVGINLAVQDAVAAARMLAEPLRRHQVSTHHLAAVQRRRTLPTSATQLQRLLHRRVLAPVLQGRDASPPRWLLAAAERFPRLTVVPARVIGVGVLPERAPDLARRPTDTPVEADHRLVVHVGWLAAVDEPVDPSRRPLQIGEHAIRLRACEVVDVDLDGHGDLPGTR